MHERRRNQASYDRNVKINELLKFSKTFKLATPVPKDLVPILAKDPNKQETIIQRAQKQADEKSSPQSKAPQVLSEQQQKPGLRGPGPSRFENGASAAVPFPTQPERQGFARGRPPYPPPPGPYAGGQGGRFQPPIHPGRGGTGMLGHRLTDSYNNRKGVAGPLPTPLAIGDSRLPPSGPGSNNSAVSSPSKVHTPTSSVASSKFNVKASEFRPNPAASTFTPGTSASPMTRGLSGPRAASPSMFFGARKLLPISERPSLTDQFNPIKRLKKEMDEQDEKDYSFNGGIPPAYKTPPTWDVAPENEEKKYIQMFRQPVIVPSISPQARAMTNPQFPQQVAFPFPQTSPNLPPIPGTVQGTQPFPSQPATGPVHFEDHRVQFPASTSQVFSTPRPQSALYPSPLASHAQLAFAQPMPQFYMNQPTPQPGHVRPYPATPQFMNTQTAMGAPMMVQQSSSGPYMNVPQGVPYATPQMQVFSPSPAHAHAYPQVPPPQPHGGYPSPSRTAPMMMHQGSQPGRPPQPVMSMTPAQNGQPVYSSQHPPQSMF